MKGSLRERQPGNWELIVQLPRDPETGLRKQLSRTHYGTKREAQRALAALVASPPSCMSAPEPDDDCIQAVSAEAVSLFETITAATAP